MDLNLTEHFYFNSNTGLGYCIKHPKTNQVLADVKMFKYGLPSMSNIKPHKYFPVDLAFIIPEIKQALPINETLILDSKESFDSYFTFQFKETPETGTVIEVEGELVKEGIPMIKWDYTLHNERDDTVVAVIYSADISLYHETVRGDIHFIDPSAATDDMYLKNLSTNRVELACLKPSSIYGWDEALETWEEPKSLPITPIKNLRDYKYAIEVVADVNDADYSWCRQEYEDLSEEDFVDIKAFFNTLTLILNSPNYKKPYNIRSLEEYLTPIFIEEHGYEEDFLLGLFERFLWVPSVCDMPGTRLISVKLFNLKEGTFEVLYARSK